MKNRWKIVAFVLLAAMLVSLSACGSHRADPGQTDVTPKTEPAEDHGNEPAPEAAETAAPEPTPEPTPTPDPYYRDLLDAIRAADSRVVLPEEGQLFTPDSVWTKYVQGSYGQGILLMSAASDGERLGVIEEGSRVTVYTTQGPRGLVRTEDGRYGWATLELLVDRFDPDRSYKNLKAYLIDRPEEWTSPAWYDFIIKHADDLPEEMVKAAKGEEEKPECPWKDGDYYVRIVDSRLFEGVWTMTVVPLECFGTSEDEKTSFFRSTGDAVVLVVGEGCVCYDGTTGDYETSIEPLVSRHGLDSLLWITIDGGLVKHAEVPAIGYEITG